MGPILRETKVLSWTVESKCTNERGISLRNRPLIYISKMKAYFAWNKLQSLHQLDRLDPLNWSGAASCWIVWTEFHLDDCHSSIWNFAAEIALLSVCAETWLTWLSFPWSSCHHWFEDNVHMLQHQCSTNRRWNQNCIRYCIQHPWSEIGKGGLYICCDVPTLIMGQAIMFINNLHSITKLKSWGSFHIVLSWHATVLSED